MVTQALRDRPEKLQRLLELNQQLSATLDLPELLQSIVDAAAELTESEQASIAQYFPEDKTLRFIAARWMDPQVMAETRIPLDDSIAGRAFQEQRPVTVQDAQKEDFYRKVDKASGFTTRSVLSVPMTMRGEEVGVLSAVNKKGKAKFDTQDVIVLETLASQAAIALHNSQLLLETKKAYQQLAELDEMKNNFISITSHELRIPLGLVLGHATYLKDLASTEMLEQIEVIERSALRLKEIVEDLSQIEHMQTDQITLRPKPLDLSELLGKLFKSYEKKAEEGKIELSSRLPTEALTIEGEAEKLQIGVDHLLKNAFAFTDPNGRIELNLEDAGDWVLIHVVDTGIGIPKEDLERIFDRFYQVEAHMTRRHGGMGVGLTVAQFMVELHGGDIQVESVKGKGSRFTIRIPKRRRIKAATQAPLASKTKAKI